MAEMGHINVNDLVKDVTVTVNIPISGYKKFRFRLYVGKILISLGIRIIGANVEVIED